MSDFHLGDRVMWITERETGIIIDLLDYEEKKIGLIGVILDSTKEFRQLKARDCKLYSFPDPLKELNEWLEQGNNSFPPGDCY